MKLHPLHPVSVHAPIACFLFTPLGDLAALLLRRAEFSWLSAYAAAGAVLFGLIAASFGALDFEKGRAAAPRTMIWHASLMGLAVVLAGVSAAGRFGHDFTLTAPTPSWALATGVLALIVAGAGGFMGGDLVYRHGVNVERG